MKIKFIAILLVLSVILSMVSTGCSNEATQFTPWENSHWEKLLSDYVDAIVIDPNDSNIIYVTTVKKTQHGHEHDKVLITEDGGKSWKEDQTKKEEDITNMYLLSVYGSDNSTFYNTFVNPSNSQIILREVLSSSVIERSVDSGKNWEKVFYGGLIAPQTSEIVYCVNEGGIYFSLDFGKTWERTPLPLISHIPSVNTYSIAIDPKNPNIIYAGSYSGLFKRVEGKGNYEYYPVCDSLNTSEIFIDPNNQNSLYAVSYPYFTDFELTYYPRSGVFATFHSIDSGKTWKKLGDYYFNPLLPDMLLKLEKIKPTSFSKKLSVSVDNGQSFKPSNLDLTKNNIYSIAVGENGIIYAATYLGLFKSEDKGLTWNLINNLKDYEWELTDGETTFNSRLIVSPYDPNTVYWAAELLKSNDAGKTWEKLNVPQLGKLHRGSAITIDPNNRNTIYLGITTVPDIEPPPIEEQMKQGLYVSKDNGNTFEKIGFDGYRISAISVSPNTGIIYIGTAFNGSFKSTNNGKTWERIPLDNDIHLSISSLSIDTKNNIVYIGVLGGGIFKIEDKK